MLNVPVPEEKFYANELFEVIPTEKLPISFDKKAHSMIAGKYQTVPGSLLTHAGIPCSLCMFLKVRSVRKKEYTGCCCNNGILRRTARRVQNSIYISSA
jgi:hypothetical protein